MSSCKSAEDTHINTEDSDVQVGIHTSEITPLLLASTPLVSHIPQSDSGICLTPQSQGDVASPQQQTVSGNGLATGLGFCDEHHHHAPLPPDQKDTGISLTPCDGGDSVSSPPGQKDSDVGLSPLGQGSDVPLPPEEKDAGLSLNQSCENSEHFSPEQKSSEITHSETEGFCSEVSGNLSFPSEEKKSEIISLPVLQHTVPSTGVAPSVDVHRTEEKQDRENNGELSTSPVPTIALDSTSHTLQTSTSTLGQSYANFSSNHPARIGNITSDESRSHMATPEPPRSSRSHWQGRSSGIRTPDNFTFQTKYLVLQFLHQATNEQHLLTVSQNSLSTSESEPRRKSRTQLLREQWQDSRSHSSPISPVPSQRPRPLAKTKGSRSSPNLKDADFFKDMPKVRTPNRRRKTGPSPKTAIRRSPRSAKPVSPQMTFLRSVSQTTDNSENGTYYSDADDELDTSFDSSHQGSVTSASFRNRLSHFQEREQMRSGRTRLPTVLSDAESQAENSLSMAEESVTSPVEDETALPILSLDQINLEQLPVSPVVQHARVNDYLVRMSESSTADPDATLQNHDEAGLDEVDSPIFGQLSHSLDQTPTNAEQVHQSQGLSEDEVMSVGFEPHETHSDPVVETEEGACGGVDPADVHGDGGFEGPSMRGDRSRLTLDLCAQPDNTFLVDAVLTLQQEIEEEMSSFESECEEALQSLHSDHSWFNQSSGMNHSRSFSPETAEAARILARIGDDIQQRHFENLHGAVGRFMLDNCAGIFSYEHFRDAALTALDKDLNGWRQVATLLVYSQHVALQLARTGHRGLHKVVDYTVQLLADTAADFIIQHGGWYGISSSIPSSPDGTAPGGMQQNPFHGYFNTTTTIGERSSSAPDLTSALQQQHSTPDSSGAPTPTNRATLEEEESTRPESSTTGDAGGSTTTTHNLESENVTAVDCTDSASVAGAENGGDGEDGENVEGGGSGEEGVVSNTGSSLVNMSVLAKTAVSVGLLACGAALALSFSRGYM